ncbi:MAG: transcription initiation factor IIB [Candidatus Altiarchaeota archaeon]|nr:transcription initiation factor IIB [Candidatus Altiarchaeota archaeon]
MALVVHSSGDTKKCPKCNSESLMKDFTRGELVCKKCGAVLEENMIDFSQEWREFDSGDANKRRRAGAPISLARHDKGISTEIGMGFSDIFKLPPKLRPKFLRLKKWQQRISTATERNLKYALAELKRYTSQLNLPPGVEEAAALVYRRAVAKELVRGRSMESVVAASLYTACREHGTPRTLDEIADVANIPKREIGRTFRFLARQLGIRILPTDPADYIPRFASQLNLSGITVTKSLEILKKAKELELSSGRGPTGVAAAVLYIAAQLTGEKKTQREVADVAGVTEVTIRNRYKELTKQMRFKELEEKPVIIEATIK